VEIEGTLKTPEVHFESGKIIISGRSILEDSSTFYRSLSDLLDDYTSRQGKIKQIDLRFEYINCNSTRCLAEMLRKLEKVFEQGNQFTINWYYPEDDDSIKDIGMVMQSMTNIPFNILETV
jgi:hypothetical protein